MKKVLLIAPILSRSGYGEMARFALRSMMDNPNVELYLHSINWGKTGWIWRDDSERRLIDSLLQKTVFYRQNGGRFDASVQCTIPNEWQRLTPYDVGYTAGIETSKVSTEWLVKGNEMDKIITISNHSKNVFANTKYDGTNTETGETIKDYSCTTPIDVVGFPIKDITPVELDINPRHDFNFLCVAQLGPRKNIDGVLNNFIEEFKDEDVGLIFKVSGANDSVMDYYNTKGMFAHLSKTLKEEGHKCSINLLHGNLTDEQMHGLYKHPKIKALVSLTHGEGFGLPLYEAAYSGLPIIATDWSGHLDFLTVTNGKRKQKLFAPVKYSLNPIPGVAVWENVLSADSQWAYVDDKDAKKKMRDVYKNYSKWEKKAKKLIKHCNTIDNCYEEFNKSLGLDTISNAESVAESGEVVLL